MAVTSADTSLIEVVESMWIKGVVRKAAALAYGNPGAMVIDRDLLRSTRDLYTQAFAVWNDAWRARVYGHEQLFGGGLRRIPEETIDEWERLRVAEEHAYQRLLGTRELYEQARRKDQERQDGGV